jgi:hypothetical protein
LNGVFYPRCGARYCGSQFVACCRKLRLLRCNPHLFHQISEIRIRGREGQRAFGLDFQGRRAAVRIGGIYNNIVKRMCPHPLLKTNSLCVRAGKPTRLSSCYHRKQIICSDGGFEMCASISRGGGSDWVWRVVLFGHASIVFVLSSCFKLQGSLQPRCSLMAQANHRRCEAHYLSNNSMRVMKIGRCVLGNTIKPNYCRFTS